MESERARAKSQEPESCCVRRLLLSELNQAFPNRLQSLAKDRKRSESELKELANAHERVSAQKKSLEGLCRSLQSEVRSLREGASSSSGRDAAGDASAVGSSSPAGEAIETAIKEGAAEEQAKAAPSAAEAEVAADTAGAAEAGHDGGTST